MASRRPTLSCPGSNTVSTPYRPLAAQYRTASEPYCASSSVGTTTFPLDFDIFFLSGSRIHPEMAASDQGSESNSRCERVTVANSHVLMISCDCGRRSIGNTRANRSGSVPQRAAICGVSEEVAHVSITSGSAMNPPATPRRDSSYPGAGSAAGSTGSASSDNGTIGDEYTGEPAASSGYHTGNGTPKNRCREISQSPARPSTQFSYRTRMCAGCQLSSRPRSSSSERMRLSRPPFRMYHCPEVTISSGLSPRS